MKVKQAVDETTTLQKKFKTRNFIEILDSAAQIITTKLEVTFWLTSIDLNYFLLSKRCINTWAAL